MGLRTKEMLVGLALCSYFWVCVVFVIGGRVAQDSYARGHAKGTWETTEALTRPVASKVKVPDLDSYELTVWRKMHSHH